MKKCIWFIVLISCLLCGCISKDMTSDSQLMDSRDVDSTEENENAKEDVAELRSQEKFNSAYVVNASIGKNWFIKRQYTLGFSLEMKNLLNDQDIKTGGYEQVRLLKNKDTSYQTYQPFDSKYFYMFGSTYYLNLYFRF